jgi:hypothetical protein
LGKRGRRRRENTSRIESDFATIIPERGPVKEYKSWGPVLNLKRFKDRDKTFFE